jgi:hypothetical protein
MPSKLVKNLSDKGYPYHDKNYRKAHAEADNKEKRKFPKGYKKLKTSEKKLGNDELMGKNTRAGKIEVEKKFKKYKDEISYHEREEHKALKRLNRKK